jgi:hypothetical protein
MQIANKADCCVIRWKVPRYTLVSLCVFTLNAWKCDDDVLLVQHDPRSWRGWHHMAMG